MAQRNDKLTPTERIQAIMDEFGVDWEAAALWFTIENGDAFIDDIVFEWSADRDPADAPDGRHPQPTQESLAAAGAHSKPSVASGARVTSDQAVETPRSAKNSSSAA